MALTHLVDTSVLTRLRHEDVRAIVEPLASSGSLARAGITDLAIDYIAAAAEANDLTVVHYDADFNRIGAVTDQRVEWVVPAGSVD